MLHSKFPCMNSYSTSDVIDVHEDSDSYVFKKFINAAIYVEKSIKKLGSDSMLHSDSMRIKKTKRCTCSNDADGCFFHPSLASGDGIKYTKSEIQLNCNNAAETQQWNDGNNNKLKEIRERQRVINTRRIVSTCSIRNNHRQLGKEDHDKYFNVKLGNLEENFSPNTMVMRNERKNFKIKDRNSFEYQRKAPEEEQITRKNAAGVLLPENPPQDIKKDDNVDIEYNESTSSSPSSSTLTGCTIRSVNNVAKNRTKFTLSSMTSCTLSENETVKQWLMRKLEEQNQRKINEMNEKRRKEEERQKILEKERENFKLWLAKKKKIEEQQRALFEKQQQQWASIRKVQLERKRVQNQLEFERWLQKKNEMKMAMENLERLRAMQKKIDNQRRLEMNEAAFQQWVKTAKNKPTPIPLNRGLDSLRSSVSVTYINPVPWVPNIEQKPASQ
ncbi:hypothetical protein WA026_017165 [Henosepilachna vigintioctopunctata]|uniref:Coiled-coil domain-containing protein n=1 Tax=Henosepilachna vigintioctopunctata TaxID=420089 RepID=A0AAW1ULI4_9CUCU